MHSTFKNDIDLEAGQTYLFYVIYSDELKDYVIQGFQYGTCEIDNIQTNTKSTRSDATILNKRHNVLFCVFYVH